VEAGAARIVGTRTKEIIATTTQLLNDKRVYERMSRAVNPYGDGRASERIVARLLKEAH
jgi:UDP-N-acetylglucosamine 2-epimerase (non-hydrolysing)